MFKNNIKYCNQLTKTKCIRIVFVKLHEVIKWQMTQQTTVIKYSNKSFLSLIPLISITKVKVA